MTMEPKITDSDICQVCGLFKRTKDVSGDACPGHPAQRPSLAPFDYWHDVEQAEKMLDSMLPLPSTPQDLTRQDYDLYLRLAALLNPMANALRSPLVPTFIQHLEQRGLYMPPGILTRLIAVANCQPRAQALPDDARFLAGVIQELCPPSNGVTSPSAPSHIEATGTSGADTPPPHGGGGGGGGNPYAQSATLTMSNILAEVERARAKHPDWPANDTLFAAAIVAEESGELMRAAVQHKGEGGSLEACDKEAIQTAAVAIRFLERR